MVRRVREARGWSQETLASRLKEDADLTIDQSGVARIESGKRAIRLNEVQAIAALLNIDLRLGRTPTKSEAEEANVAIDEATARLAVVEREFKDVSRQADRLRAELGSAESRLQELHVRRAEITAILQRLERNVYDAANARKRLEEMTADGDR